MDAGFGERRHSLSPCVRSWRATMLRVAPSSAVAGTSIVRSTERRAVDEFLYALLERGHRSRARLAHAAARRERVNEQQPSGVGVIAQRARELAQDRARRLGPVPA